MGRSTFPWQKQMNKSRKIMRNKRWKPLDLKMRMKQQVTKVKTYKKNSMAQQSMFQRKINMRTCKKPFTHMLQKKMTNKKFTDTHRMPNLPSLPGDRR